ncbi:hypothetical protein WI697_26395 [Tistrella mobilis]|uniref:hypothetical protein n=1 Tax=Tistrella mobilis TaxID=171437 RepID=UPI0031F639A1
MKPPSLLTYLLGNGLVMLGLMLAVAATGYLIWLDSGQAGRWIAGVGLAWLLDQSMQAHDRLRLHRARRRAWESMAARTEPAPPPKPRRHAARQWLGMLLLGLFGLAYAIVMRGTPSYGLGLGCVVAAAGLMLWRLARRRREARAATRPGAAMVTVVVVQRSLLPVPPMTEAYRQLPDYCLRLLLRSYARQQEQE